jgi:hypothetical protein
MEESEKFHAQAALFRIKSFTMSIHRKCRIVLSTALDAFENRRLVNLEKPNPAHSLIAVLTELPKIGLVYKLTTLCL